MSWDWERDLDPQQWAAVSHPGGPVIVLAGAGSGKTRVLTYRIAYLLAQGVPPSAILALTFTNKAADTMRQRLLDLVGPSAQAVSMGTFHSTFARWLRRHLSGTPVSNDFTIYDEDDVKGVLRNILKEINGDPRQVSTYRSLISRWKNEGYSWREVRPTTPPERLAVDIYRHYEARLRAANALDFDDLLLETERLLRREPAVLQHYQHTLQHILVDEYQDTNPLQYRILKLIAAYHKNLFVVGDDAQSIYGFRGADIRNFRYLEKDFSPVTIIRLEQNYRSTPQILEVANALLKHSKELYPKRLFTKNAGGPKPYLQTGCLNVQEEASFVVKKIREEVARHHLSYRDFAVLYRTNAYSRAFEEAFRAARIPYRLVGTISFYQREEVKHLLAFLRFLVNPHDEQALLRVLVVVGEGIGESSLERMRKLSMERGESLWAVWPEAVTYLKGPAQRAAEAFYVRMWRFRENCLALPLPEQVERVLYEGGLWNYYEKDDRAQERWDNLRELVGAAQEFALQAGEQASLRDFLERAALSSSTDDPSGDPPEAVWLSTVHGVKGLEFHTVFLVGVIEGLFPHGYAHEQGIEALEEERRIFYVALTRASRHLYLTQPQYDMRFREQRPAVPSRFLREIGLIEEPLRPAVVGLSRNWNTSSSNKVPSSVSPLSFVPTDPAELQPGCWVEHSHFGRGRILSREENGSAGVIQVQFDTVGVKKLDLRYAKLRRVS